MSDEVSVTGLFVYPVKGCRGLAVAEAGVGRRGLESDRQWMVVDGAGRFLSQRSHPQLARVTVAVGPDGLRLETEALPPLLVPFGAGAGRRVVEIWNERVDTVDQGKDAAAWFSELLGTPAALVGMPESTQRQVDPRRARPGDEVSFADAFPILLISQGSLDELNRRLERPLPMDRFRPNIVVAGCPPHAEDGWRRVRIGTVGFRVAKPCARCVVTTTDQRTGEREAEPLRTLSGYRQVEGKVLFGQNLVHYGHGVLRVGDRCEVVTR